VLRNVHDHHELLWQLLLLLLLLVILQLTLPLPLALPGPLPQRRRRREKPVGRRAWVHVVFCRDRKSRQKIPSA
jgi:hypothetical protein